jgi:redox-sensitive bicupin YhaK (pirin superfamily)
MDLKIPPRKHDLGDGFTVNRVLPYAKKRMVGPFIFWDHMGPVFLKTGNEMVVRPHPHIGLATLTYLFEGEIYHQDSLGIKQAIKPGEVNWMIAGKGIVHSERTAPIADRVRGKYLHGIQLWIALPKSHEEVEPTFHHFSAEEIPTFSQNQSEVRLIAGSAFGKTSPVPTFSPLFYLEVFCKKGEKFVLPLNDHEGALYLLKGRVETLESEILPLEMGVFTQEISITALEDSHFMLLGGEPFPEDRTIWWNFVNSSKVKIEEAKILWKNQQMGKVAGETEYIPLPNDPI